MKNAPFWILAAASAIIVASSWLLQPQAIASARLLPKLASADFAKSALTVGVKTEPAKVETPSAEQVRLEAYVLGSMNLMVPPKTQPDHDGSHYAIIARDIVAVVLDPSEKPIWGDDRWKSAILLVSIAMWESRFWLHVLDGRCNSASWQASKEGKKLTGISGNCDATWASGPYQVHAYDGIALTEDGGWVGAWGAKGRRLFFGKDLLADGQLAARVALHIARASIERNGTLLAYTGEGSCPCPKANARLSYAKTWMRQHPYVDAKTAANQ